jgi:hypothetical protein
MSNKHKSSKNAAVANRILDLIGRTGPVARIARKSAVNVMATTVQSLKAGLLLGLAGSTAGMVLTPRKPAAILGISGVITLAAASVLAYTQRLNAEQDNGPLDEIDLLNRPGPIQLWPKKGDPAAAVFRVPYGKQGLNWEKRRRQVNGYPVTTLKIAGLLGREYHFHGYMSNWEAVQIAAGLQQTHETAGYVGTISSAEKLSPAWALLKRRLIEAALAGGPELEPTGQRLNALGQVRLNREVVADLKLEPGDLVVFLKNEAERWEIWTEEGVLDALVESVAASLGAEYAPAACRPAASKIPEMPAWMMLACLLPSDLNGGQGEKTKTDGQVGQVGRGAT